MGIYENSESFNRLRLLIELGKIITRVGVNLGIVLKILLNLQSL